MAGPIRGSIEHYFAGTGLTTGSAQAIFVNAYNFLNNNTGTLGIQRIAYNTGSQDTGMTQFRGMNFYDVDNPAGQNAFAVFRFSSASFPYEILIQWSGNSTLGTAPGAPALLNNGSSTSAFAFAFAQRTGSLSSWNGSTLNNGNDRKSTPVWFSGSSVAYFPRSNDSSRAGTHASQKQNMMGVANQSSATWRMHFIADYDNFVFVYDSGADNSYQIGGMLKYTPTTDLTSSLPYFSFFTTLPTAAGTIYGPVTGDSSDAGGISYPSLVSSGTCAMTFEKLGTTLFQTITAEPNRMFPVQRFDEFPLFVGGFESPNQIGYVGQHYEFLREVYNIATHDTNLAGTRAVFGNSGLASAKLTVPWHSGTTPGTGVTRGGVQFGF